MFIGRGVDRENVYTYSGILVSLKKGTSAVCDNMDEP